MIELCRYLLVVSFGMALSLGLSGQVAAGQQLQKIREVGEINIGYDSNPPFVYTDADRKAAGFEVELSEAIAKELGVKAKMMFSKQDNLVASLIHGYGFNGRKRADIIIGEWTGREDYKENFDFSEPYIISGIQALTMKKNAGMIKSDTDLIGKKIGTYQYPIYPTVNAPKTIGETYDDRTAMYHDLSNDVIDVVLENRFDAVQMVNAHAISKEILSYAVGYLIEVDRLPEMALSGELLFPREVGIALRKGEPELKAAVNQALKRLRADGTLKKISETYFGADVTQ